MSKKQPSQRHKKEIAELQDLIKSKEYQTALKDIADRDTTDRNIPAFHNLLLNNPSFQNILFDVFFMSQAISSIERQIMANSSLSGQARNDEALYEQLLQNLTPMLNPDLIMQTLGHAIKETKIKKDRRLIFWALAEFLNTFAQNQSIDDSLVARCIVMASFTRTSQVFSTVQEIITTSPLAGLTYNDFMDKPLDLDSCERITGELLSLNPDVGFLLTTRALELFDRVKEPFGMRFYRVLHYPSAFRDTKSNLILTPGQEQKSQEEEESAQERSEKMLEAALKDVSNHTNHGLLRELLQSIRSAAFGQVELNQIEHILNAAVYAMFIPISVNPFFLKLYDDSGKNWDKINPEEEKHFILDIKGSPDQSSNYRRYADHLYEKEHYEGALMTYRHSAQLLDEPDETIDQRIKEIEGMLGEPLYEKMTEEQDDQNDMNKEPDKNTE